MFANTAKKIAHEHLDEIYKRIMIEVYNSSKQGLMKTEWSEDNMNEYTTNKLIEDGYKLKLCSGRWIISWEDA